MRNQITILLVEPDSYKDIVLLFEKQLKKTWIAPPPVIWANETETISSDVIRPLNCGGDPKAFCGRLKKGVEAAGTKWVVFWNADILPTKPIDSKEIDRVIDYMQEHGMLYCKLAPVFMKRIKRVEGDPYLYVMDADRPYSLSFTFCIIENEYLLSLIKDPNWTGWQLEEYGLLLAREKKNDKCLYHDGNIGETVHLINKSKIIPESAKKLEEKGIDISSIHREKLSNKEVIIYKLKGFGGRYCPQKLRKTVKSIAGFCGIKMATKY